MNYNSVFGVILLDNLDDNLSKKSILYDGYRGRNVFVLQMNGYSNNNGLNKLCK